MIFNKNISLVLTGCFFLMVLMLVSLTLKITNNSLSYFGIIFIIIVFVLSRSFYYYLRSDDEFKNNRKKSSDRKGEHYLSKGETDIKKIFVIGWVLVMLILLFVLTYLNN